MDVPSVALVCTGLGNVTRGNERLMEEIFRFVSPYADITLFQGGGATGDHRHVTWNLPRSHQVWTGVRGLITDPRAYVVEQLSFSVGLLRALRRSSFDVIHLSDGVVENVIHHLLKDRTQFKLLLTNGGPAFQPIMLRVDHVHQLTQHAFDIARENGVRAERMSVIPPGINLTEFRPGSPHDFRQRLRIAPSAPVILSVGMIAKRHKRMDFLVKAVSMMETPDVFLLIVGPPTDETEDICSLGKRLLGDSFRALQLSQEDLGNAYNASDVFALCSLSEGAGIVFLEAMASGLPVVAHPFPSIEEIVGKGGEFVSMTSHEQLAMHLDNLLCDQLRMKKMTSEGLRRTRTMYSWEVLKAKYLEMYRYTYSG